jgi:hypothetical protein
VVTAGGPTISTALLEQLALAGVVAIQHSDIVEGYAVMILGPW